MKTGDIYNYFLINPKAEFKRLKTGTIFSFDKDGILKSKDSKDNKDNYIMVFYLQANDDWELLPEKVDFLIAIKAYHNGKQIYSKYNGNTYNYNKNINKNSSCLRDENEGAISSGEILYGEWYIRENIEEKGEIDK